MCERKTVALVPSRVDDPGHARPSFLFRWDFCPDAVICMPVNMHGARCSRVRTHSLGLDLGKTAILLLPHVCGVDFLRPPCPALPCP